MKSSRCVELGKTLHIDGMYRTCIRMENNLALLECRYSELGPITSYDVVRYRWMEPQTFPNGAKSKAGLFLSGTQTWGRDGWTYKSKEEAEQHFLNATVVPATQIAL